MTAPLTVNEAARILGVTPRRVRQLVESGALPATRFGREWAIARGSVEDRVKARRIKAQGEN